MVVMPFVYLYKAILSIISKLNFNIDNIYDFYRLKKSFALNYQSIK